MATLFGVDVARIIGDAFNGQVQSGTLIRLVDRPPIPGEPDRVLQVEERYPFQGFTDQRDRKGHMTAKMVVILGASIAVEPSDSDQIEIGGETLSVSSVESDFTKAVFNCIVG